MWHRMNPIELEMAEELWKKTNKTVSMLPLADLEYAEWTEINGDTSSPYFNVIRNYGTRAKETGKLAGIVRKIYWRLPSNLSRNLFESTYDMDGNMNGLSRSL